MRFIGWPFRKTYRPPSNMGLKKFAIEMKSHVSQPPVSHGLGILLVASCFLLHSANAGADNERGKRIYRENCAPCHGVSGRGDGVGAQSLPVRPADHTDGKLMGARSDVFLQDVITNGGSATGLSSFMPAWKGIFKEDEIRDLVAYIRSLAQPPK
jgi:mono/diheme cytochrome c family protein